MTKKILFLHGYAQSANIFSGKTGGLRKNLIKQGYETIYVQGPLKLTGDSLHSSSATDVETYGWWRFGPDFDASDAIETVLEEVKKHEEGSIEGIIGFSQGAGLGGFLAARSKELIPSLKFAIFFSGFRLLPTKYEEYYESKIQIPTLHVIGELDTVVEEFRCIDLYDASEDSKRTLLKHQGGHFVPNNKFYVNTVLNWIISNTKELDVDEEKKQGDINDDDLFDKIDNIGKA